MRISAILLAAATSLLLSVSSAQAVNFSFVIVSGDTNAGSNVVLDLLVDGETDQLQAWFMQVDHAGNTAVGSSIEPFVFHGGGAATPLGAPVNNGAAGGNATGQFAMSINPPGFIAPGSGPVKFGQISFNNLQNGTIQINISEAGGAVVGLGGVILPYTSATITVPEPSLAAMGFISLVTVGLIRRRVRIS